MVQWLPKCDFRWASQDEIDRFQVKDTIDDSDTGFILDVDLGYPDQIHDDHNDYPLAPERLTVMHEMLSPYSKIYLKT